MRRRRAASSPTMDPRSFQRARGQRERLAGPFVPRRDPILQMAGADPLASTGKHRGAAVHRKRGTTGGVSMPPSTRRCGHRLGGHPVACPPEGRNLPPKRGQTVRLPEVGSAAGPEAPSLEVSDIPPVARPGSSQFHHDQANQLVDGTSQLSWSTASQTRRFWAWS